MFYLFLIKFFGRYVYFFLVTYYTNTRDEQIIKMQSFDQ